MPSTAQYTANQANAQLSTGPRTAEGKARVSQNARTHGFTSQSLLVAEADRPAFDTLRTGLIEDTRPEGALENEIFRSLLNAMSAALGDSLSRSPQGRPCQNTTSTACTLLVNLAGGPTSD